MRRSGEGGGGFGVVGKLDFFLVNYHPSFHSLTFVLFSQLCIFMYVYKMTVSINSSILMPFSYPCWKWQICSVCLIIRLNPSHYTMSTYQKSKRKYIEGRGITFDFERFIYCLFTFIVLKQNNNSKVDIRSHRMEKVFCSYFFHFPSIKVERGPGIA